MIKIYSNFSVVWRGNGRLKVSVESSLDFWVFSEILHSIPFSSVSIHANFAMIQHFWQGSWRSGRCGQNDQIEYFLGNTIDSALFEWTFRKESDFDHNNNGQVVVLLFTIWMNRKLFWNVTFLVWLALGTLPHLRLIVSQMREMMMMTIVFIAF